MEMRLITLGDGRVHGPLYALWQSRAHHLQLELCGMPLHRLLPNARYRPAGEIVDASDPADGCQPFYALNPNKHDAKPIMALNVSLPPGSASGTTGSAPGPYRWVHAMRHGMMPKRVRMPNVPALSSAEKKSDGSMVAMASGGSSVSERRPALIGSGRSSAGSSYGSPSS
eukprot:CAMPEP_0181172224 /NCGR_PEP_ID=MMETSP1096-20121128/2337_1 /TAXON_ID=156174 ORGANISM="Chrysochromulina ericina, Strain CCMP281" /NCGR_SAMPLE_ID=MMETSP1096 /ASSEMBLY_ACC=CAM_ASM_000453 /LENGTH=169 /DNA_ID=CAMNT_0023259941 /DNA_START=293 /DNA_END=799 /DNA_ORIENTATION=-